MSNINTQENEVVSKTDEIVGKITQIAAIATQQDREKFSAMQAKSATPSAEVAEITPGLAALIFKESNKRNRDWKYTVSESLARQMQNGEWRLNGQGLQFYKDGKLADGQHRSAAIALSGVTVPISVFYGMERDAIVTIDCGKKRSAADAMHMDGVSESKLIEQLVKTANAYEIKSKVEGVKRLESNSEILEACSADMKRVKRAIEIGTLSVKGISNPTLSTAEAAKVAYVFIKNGWNEDRVTQQLAFFQTGQDENESSPMFKVATAINRAKARKNAGERLAAMSQIGLIVKAFQLTEEGVKAVQSKVLAEIQAGKVLPNPKRAA